MAHLGFFVGSAQKHPTSTAGHRSVLTQLSKALRNLNLQSQHPPLKFFLPKLPKYLAAKSKEQCFLTLADQSVLIYQLL